MGEESENKIRTFRVLARLGFYATVVAVACHAAHSMLSMSYLAHKVIDKGVVGCLIAGFVFSLLAIITGVSARLAFRKEWGFYLLAGLGLIVSGRGLWLACYVILRKVLWRFGVNI